MACVCAEWRGEQGWFDFTVMVLRLASYMAFPCSQGLVNNRLIVYSKGNERKTYNITENIL